MTKKRRRRHTPEQIVAKLRDADAMLNAGKDLAVVLQTLEIAEATYHRWRQQYGGQPDPPSRSGRVFVDKTWLQRKRARRTRAGYERA